MNTIIDQIKAIQLDTRKNRATTEHADMIISLTTTLIGESDTIAKNAQVEKISDVDMLALVKKFIKNLDITIGSTTGAAKDHAVLEKTFLLQFMPQQMSESELTAIVSKFVSEVRASNKVASMGAVMQHLKDNHSGLYDAKLASTIIKSQL